MKVIATLALLLLVGCSGSQKASDEVIAERMGGEVEETAAEVEAEVTQESEETGPTVYYAGITTTTSPDGKKHLHSTEALVKREYDESSGVITETVLHDGELVTVELRPTDEENVYSVEPADGSYSGTLKFNGPAWEASHWEYDLTLEDGTTVTGIGQNNGEALVIEKEIHDGSGATVAKQMERLPEVQKSIYDAKVTALVR